MKKILILIGMFIILQAEDIKFINITNIHDGDTFSVDINCTIDTVCKNIPIRVYGIDTPEIRTLNLEEKKQANISKDFTTNFLKGDITLKDCKRDKYFRLNCSVINDRNELLDKELIKNKLGVPYFGGTKEKFK